MILPRDREELIKIALYGIAILFIALILTSISTRNPDEVDCKTKTIMYKFDAINNTFYYFETFDFDLNQINYQGENSTIEYIGENIYKFEKRCENLR